MPNHELQNVWQSGDEKRSSLKVQSNRDRIIRGNLNPSFSVFIVNVCTSRDSS